VTSRLNRANFETSCLIGVPPAKGLEESSLYAEHVSDDVTRTLRKSLPPHKQKAPVASKRRGRL